MKIKKEVLVFSKLQQVLISHKVLRIKPQYLEYINRYGRPIISSSKLRRWLSLFAI